MTTNRTGFWNIEAWKGMDCVWFGTFVQRRGAATKSARAICDFGDVDRVYISRTEADGTNGGTIASWTPGRGWTCDDPRIESYLVG